MRGHVGASYGPRAHAPAALLLLAGLLAAALHAKTASGQQYVVIMSGRCATQEPALQPIYNLEECRAAVLAQGGLNGFTDTDPDVETTLTYPGGCYYYNKNSLWLNTRTDSTSGCTFSNECFCSKPCDKGTFTKDGACVPCAAGEYSALPGQETCQKCPLGKSSLGSKQTSADTCKACAAGRYADVLGSSSCTSCAAGFAMSESIDAPSKSSSDCKACEAGRYIGQQAHSGSCKLCVAGQFSLVGAVLCADCAAGKFLSAGSSAKVPCCCHRQSRFYCRALSLRR